MIDEVRFTKAKQKAMSIMPDREYHNEEHVIRVVDNIKELCDSERASVRKKLVLAAYFHDTGYVTGSSYGHEKVSAEIARQELMHLGYDKSFSEEIAMMILDTRINKNPQTFWGAYLSDADTVVFGESYQVFYTRNVKAKKELYPDEDEIDRIKKFIEMLENHTYYSRNARQKYKDQKEENIQKLKKEFDLE